MSDGGQERASLGVEVGKSSQKLIAQRSAVRSIAWLGLSRLIRVDELTDIVPFFAAVGMNDHPVPNL